MSATGIHSEDFNKSIGIFSRPYLLTGWKVSRLFYHRIGLGPRLCKRLLFLVYERGERWGVSSPLLSSSVWEHTDFELELAHLHNVFNTSQPALIFWTDFPSPAHQSVSVHLVTRKKKEIKRAEHRMNCDSPDSRRQCKLHHNSTLVLSVFNLTPASVTLPSTLFLWYTVVTCRKFWMRVVGYQKYGWIGVCSGTVRGFKHFRLQGNKSCHS